MRIGVRMAQEGVDPIDQPIADRVLHVLGLLVDLVPGHLEGLCEEELEEPMAFTR